jgi:RNA polymerase sigma factor (sigma-70 family)
MTREHETDEDSVARDCCQRLKGFIRREARLAAGGLSSDMAADCELAAEVAIWQARHYLITLQDADRLRYCMRVGGRRIARCAERERARQLHEVSMEELAAERACPSEFPAGDSYAWEALLDEETFGPTTRRAFREALGRLPPATQTIIRLFFFADLSHAQIGERLALTPHAVRQRMYEGIRTLRRELSGPQSTAGRHRHRKRTHDSSAKP